MGWFRQHLFALVFLASLIDATGLPFPGRAILVVAGVAATERHELALLILTSALGALSGDHLLYYAGMRGGGWLLLLYCRLTLGSARCVETTVAYFKRWGAPALLVGRFSAGVRLFAAVLAGSGHISYRAFLTFDAAGTLVYATLWIVLGALFGAAILDRAGGAARLLLLLAPATVLAILAYRLWRRRRYGAAAYIR